MTLHPPTNQSRKWRFPEATQFKLSSGLNVMCFELPQQPLAAIELVLPAPTSFEPRELEGVAALAVGACDEGTNAHPDGRIAELLQLQGSELHGWAGLFQTRIGAEAPVSRLDRLWPLLAELLVEPSYAESDISHHIEQQIAAYRSALASPSSATRLAWNRALFGDDARAGRPASGQPNTISTNDPSSVRGWQRQYWRPNGATLVVAGAISATKVHDGLAADLTSWQPGGGPETAPDSPAQSTRIVVLDLPDAVQATIQLGCLTIGREHEQWAALRLAAHAMVGAFASRANLELRERLGYTYGVHGSVSARVHGGTFSVSTATRVEVAAAALGRLLDLIALPKEFTASEIAAARQYLVGVGPLANETASDIAKQAAALALAGYEPTFVTDYFGVLASTTATQANQAWQRHLSGAPQTIAISGPAAELGPALTAAGFEYELVSPY